MEQTWIIFEKFGMNEDFWIVKIKDDVLTEEINRCVYHQFFEDEIRRG